jgi:hypothetical protein
MTAHRRPLLLSAAAAALLLPACLHVTTTSPPEVRAGAAGGGKAAAKVTTEHKTDFGIFTSRPGTVVHTRPADADATARKPAGDSGPPASPPPPEAIRPAGEPDPLSLPPLTAPPGLLPEPPLVAAVREFVAGRPERALSHLQALPPANQDFALAMLPVLATGVATDLAGSPDETAELVDHLRTAADRLEGRAALRIGAVALCRHVDRFGVYEPLPGGHRYSPGHLAQVYLEVRNLTSQPARGPRGETHLTRAQVRVEVLDAYGKRAAEAVGYARELFTRGPVHDFHILHTFPVPTAPGVYTVTVEVRDPAGGRTARTAPVRFDVAGP